MNISATRYPYSVPDQRRKKLIDFRNEMKILPREKLTHGFMDIAKVSF